MYNQMFNPQLSIERINGQIAELEKMRNQIQQPVQPPTNLTQNFQLAPTNREIIRYANSLEDVKRDMVIGETPYFSKDMSIVWIKTPRGDIKTYELTEIIPKDDKDIQIEMLQAQINELKKGMVKNEQPTTNVIATKDTTDTEWGNETDGATTKEGKSSSVSRIQASKRK